MDSHSRSRKRDSEDQLENQIENSVSKAIKLSKTSFESILEPVPVCDPNVTNRPPQLASLNDDRAPNVSNYDVDLRERENREGFMMNGSSRGEGEGLSGNLVSGPVAGRVLQDYQMHLMLRERQNRRRRLIVKEEQDTALRTITMLSHRLNIAYTSVKEVLENLPTFSQNIEDFKQSIPVDSRALQRYQEDFDRKEAELKDLENRYNELIQMTPEAQKGALQQVKEKAILTMEQDWERLRLNRDNAMEKLEGKNEIIAELDVALGKTGELVPELIESLIKLVRKLRDGRRVNSSASIGASGEIYIEN